MNQDIEYVRLHMGPPCSNCDPPRDPTTHQHTATSSQGDLNFQLQTMASWWRFTTHWVTKPSFVWKCPLFQCFAQGRCSANLFDRINTWLMGKLTLKALNCDSVRWNMEVIIQSVVTKHVLCAKHSAGDSGIWRNEDMVLSKSTDNWWQRQKSPWAQTKGHSPWDGDEGNSIEEWGVGGESLQEVRHYRRLYVDWGRSERAFQLRGKGLNKNRSWISCLWAWVVCFLSRLRKKMAKIDGDLIDEGPEFQASGWAKMATKGSGIETWHGKVVF